MVIMTSSVLHLHHPILRGFLTRIHFSTCVFRDCRNESSQLNNKVHSLIVAKLSSSITDNGLKSNAIDGIWVFHRHGDRTPSCPTSSEDSAGNEANFWHTKLPPSKLHEALNDKFPVSMHASNAKGYLDVGHETYGFLTKLGCEQMKNTGSRMAMRYNSYMNEQHCRRADGHRFTANNFVNDWDICVYSTNYLRTVTSAQCFLDGLLNHTNLNPSHIPSSRARPEESGNEPLTSVHVQIKIVIL